MRSKATSQPLTGTASLLDPAHDLAPMSQKHNRYAIDPTLCQRIPADPAEAHRMALAYLAAAAAALNPETYAALAAPPHMQYRLWLAAQRAHFAGNILETLLPPR